MNSNAMKRVSTGLATVALLSVISTQAAAAQYDYARVISAEPIVRMVTVNTPVSGASTLVGAIVGGVIGHQFGSGRGNDAATIAGTMIGAAVGNDAAKRRYGASHSTVEYSRPVQRCETRMTSHREERIEGYVVIYKYHGQKYETRMPYDPGRELRIRVDIRPAG
jgi:uncharacterized protein YcfJ